MSFIRTAWGHFWLWVDWHGRMATLSLILVALGGAAIARWCLAIWSGVSGPAIWIISVLVFAVFLCTLALAGSRLRPRPEKEEVIGRRSKGSSSEIRAGAADVQQENERLSDRVLQLEERLNQSLLLSGQFKLECDELYADSVFEWLRKNIHSTGTFSGAALAESVGLSVDAVTRGLGLLRSKYQIVTQRSPGVDAWSFVAGATAFKPKFKIVALEQLSETLVERTLKLRCEIEGWVIGIGPKPKPEIVASDSSVDVTRKIREAIEPWYNKITFGYERHYAERVQTIFLEFGELGLLPIGFSSEINQAQSVEDGIRQVITRLRILAESSPQPTQRSA